MIPTLLLLAALTASPEVVASPRGAWLVQGETTLVYWPNPAVADVLDDLPSGLETEQYYLALALAERGIRFEWDNDLGHASVSHAQTCARLCRGGHHNWERRYHQLGGGVVEVAAESWPGENSVEGARECAKSWQSSPDHWRALQRARSGGLGMRRGRNGTWYGVGILR